ncbi:formylglycine-generating enzyme family protein [Rhodohalobacter halophilus]|uniref:formylglycine-generating enzyme family protein n=1 Tax=Rhodohalobacter halophilus TaxID=1812810 RepID=UPI00083F82D0|nr:formylglycine-generating enzyme family protein [Rhodohalobacter halophilus]
MKLPFKTYHRLIPVLTLLLLILAAGVQAQERAVTIPEGSFHSVLPEVEGEPHQIDAFKLDTTAVTNGEYLQFLKANPEWRRSQISPLFAGSDYLRHWEEDLRIGDKESPDQPVTRVSWFAANAYCGWQGGRLPTLNEWEFAAQAMDFENSTEANRFSSELIGWYSAVDTNSKSEVGSTGIENQYGVKDLFGLIMEWVEDFNPPVADDISLDCGTVGRMQGDPTVYSYAMSIRYITRMSFKPKSTTGMLGFRCAYDMSANEKEI